MSNANIARHLAAMAAAQPDACALKIPRGRTAKGRIDYLALTFAQLDAEVAAWQEKLAAAGVKPGDRTLVMVKPGLPLIAAVFALFREEAVPVIIDPGMGLSSFAACVARTQPRVLLGIPLAQVVSRVMRKSFRSVEVRIGASPSLTARVNKVGAASPPLPRRRDAASTTSDTLAAIVFTSGSTGAPKGVCYEHGMFDAQVRMIRDTYDIQPGEIDLPMLPIFALFNPALGLTTVVPEIDPRRPATVDPARIVQTILQEGVTNSFGSPTLWRIVSEYCARTKTTLPSLKRVLCAGAPVPDALWQASPRFLPNGELHSPYGATESLPVATVGASTRAHSPLGSALGRPVSGVDVKIIAISDGPIARWADATELEPGQIGEIIVRGPMVTRSYDHLPEATQAAKITDDQGRIWHRMGDCGLRDPEGRLWFCGRKAERVQTAQGTLQTEPCEQTFRRHARARRCALIGLGGTGAQIPALVAETSLTGRTEGAALAAELRSLGRDNPWTRDIRHFYFHPHFPVDVRHNAKIHRLTLSRWAARNRPFVAAD
ncbi:MAG TPA: fatty acid CoA ligase family protein [Opitutaceae bacterium]|jgi:acyl-CoA synthetase (AMP-forming)/AMP-acid ligase II